MCGRGGGRLLFASTSETYAEARRLLTFLSFVTGIDEGPIPQTSILREFLGGSAFEY